MATSPQAVDYWIKKMFEAQYQEFLINDALTVDIWWEDTHIDEIFDQALAHVADPENHLLNDPEDFGNSYFQNNIIDLIPKLTQQERNKLWYIFHGRRRKELAQKGQMSFLFAYERDDFSYAKEIGETFLNRALHILTHEEYEQADKQVAEIYASIYAELVKTFSKSSSIS